MSPRGSESSDLVLPSYHEFKKNHGTMSRIWRKKKIWVWFVEILFAVVFLVVVVNFGIYESRPRDRPPFRQPARITVMNTSEPVSFNPASLQTNIDHLKSIQEWRKPAELKVVGLVFFGRRRYVEILNCYLQRNLVENGGLLDEIIFVVKTGNKDDLVYLDELLKTNPKYSSYDANDAGDLYKGMWDVCEKGVMYVKIDDDVLFLEDSAIHSIVKRKVEEPQHLLVAGNIVVQPAFAWVHYHLDAIHPYLPEFEPGLPEPDHPFHTWRPSELPVWTGPDMLNFSDWEAPPHHRWLPLPSGVDTDQTPIAAVTYDPHGPGLLEWTIAAQQHYSFLENLEKQELWKYKFDLWDFKYERLSINFFAIMGDDIVAMKPLPPDDEAYLTVDYPKKTGRHAVMDGHSVAVHFSFRPMRDGRADLETTDLLDRYKAYAEENICSRT